MRIKAVLLRMRGAQTAEMAASNGGGMEVDATGEKITRSHRLTLLILKYPLH